ncbi:PREDICTED: flavonol synthase/flavanone 3-hydroxylase-like [Populus euphratica]|uniref:Flavonol synthase/flavanone 3-hydroxylase-like n=1 Tax=Populus euphratica TaxID=75702 RepID=A0AAJ6T2U6_POPEU|nr:PREDICTED: flavonol synthase/flavanone 3-hydroxylase-like [Populus euphratica]
MAISPESMPENPIDFRAPPPSPIASGRRSSVTNDEVLTEFLEHSLRVPDLILPDKIFPRQKIVETPPRIDCQSLISGEGDSVLRMLDSIARIGCFQLVNFGIPSEFIRLVSVTAAGIFQLPPGKKEAVSRSLERPYGFEEVHGDHQEAESEVSEEFVWCKDESLKLDMEGIWPTGYSNFSKKMETLSSDIEKVARKILHILHENCPRKSMYGNDMMQRQDLIGSVCCLYKHGRNFLADQWASSLGYDVMRMLIRGTDYSHALCLHTCDGSSEFHVYSKKGWVSFCPDKDALIVTVGDRTQVWSGGQYKHVFGWPIFKGDDKDCISMAFLYSPPSSNSSSSKTSKGKTVSLGQQAIFAIILTLVCHFLVYFYKEV